MAIDPDRVRAHAEKADDGELLDRVTVFRTLMEPDAVEIIEQVLRRRGFSLDRIEAYGEQAAREVLRLGDGTPAKCHFCSRAAVVRGWGWHRWKERGLPLFPRLFRFCPDHRRDQAEKGS
jgi:hypothetical protein